MLWAIFKRTLKVAFLLRIWVSGIIKVIASNEK